MRRSKAELHETVALAFADREYPGDDRIADSDPRYPTYEGHAISAFHRGKRWWEITLRHLFDDYPGDPTACLAFMRPEGWRYCLPAYLVNSRRVLPGSFAGSMADTPTTLTSTRRSRRSRT
jgi:hypothetical protein